MLHRLSRLGVRLGFLTVPWMPLCGPVSSSLPWRVDLTFLKLLPGLFCSPAQPPSGDAGFRACSHWGCSPRAWALRLRTAQGLTHRNSGLLCCFPVKGRTRSHQ